MRPLGSAAPRCPVVVRSCSLALVLCVSASAAGKRGFTIEDLYRLREPAHPVLSPDGTRLVFEVATQDLRKSTRATHLWMADLRTGSVRQITYAGGWNGSAAWSRDGRTLTFVSNREEGTQLWSMDASGGEPRRLTSFGPGVAAPELIRDGKAVVFQATVFPEALADEALNQELSERLEKGPVQAHLADSLMYRHWAEWRDWQYTHLFLQSLEGGKPEALTSGKVDYPDFRQAFAVSPDGQELCVTAKDVADPARATNDDLFLIRLDGDRKPVRLTGANAAYDGAPAYSPDGRYLAYTFQRIPGYESDRFRLGLYDRKTGAFRALTEDLDNWVEAFRWAPDGASIWFTLQEKGRNPLLKVDVATGRVTRMLEGWTVKDFVLAPDQKSVYFVASSIGRPAEVWRWTVGAKAPVAVTDLNGEAMRDVDVRPAEEMWVKGADGTPVQVWIVKPHGFDPARKYPLVLNVHGGPQMMWADTFRGDWQVYPGAGYVVAFPNPHGSTGFGQAYTAAISKDWNGKVMEDIDKVADALAGLPYVDASRMGAMGWSWGGYAMMWLEGHSKRFKALAAMMGVYDLPAMHGATEELWFPEWELGGTPASAREAYTRMNPAAAAGAFSTPCLVITGERDYRVPYTQSLAFFTDLQTRGVPSRLLVFKNDGHWPDKLKSMPAYYNAHLEWFHRWLGGDPAPWSTEALVRNRVFGAPRD